MMYRVIVLLVDKLLKRLVVYHYEVFMFKYFYVILKDDGIVVFAVGIGKGTDKVELEAIASEPKEKYLFEVGSYGLLDSVKESLAVKACEGINMIIYYWLLS